MTRIFASVRSRFTDHDRVILTPQDVRLMRRMVRDRFTRNTLPEETMAMWEEVCEGESAYINPFRDSADFKLDTTLDYEPNIFHSFLLPFLEDRGASHRSTTASWTIFTSGWMNFLTSTTPMPSRRTASSANSSDQNRHRIRRTPNDKTTIERERGNLSYEYQFLQFPVGQSDFGRQRSGQKKPRRWWRLPS